MSFCHVHRNTYTSSSFPALLYLFERFLHQLFTAYVCAHTVAGRVEERRNIKKKKKRVPISVVQRAKEPPLRVFVLLFFFFVSSLRSFGRKKTMSWNLKGRPAIAALDPPTRHRILHSHNMTRCINKPLLWVLEELCNLRCLGGLVGPLHSADYFICLVARLLQICPPPAVVRVMLEQDVHKYMRAAALVVIRLIGHVDLQKEALRIGWDDYRKLCLYGGDPAQEWAQSTISAPPAGGDPASSTLTASLLPRPHKRPRATEVEVEGGGVGDDGTPDDAPQPPRYWLVHVDEFTDYLFGAAPLSSGGEGSPTATAAEPADTTSAGRSRTLPAHVVMGVQLPALLL